MSQRNGLSDDAKVLLLWAADEGTINCSTVTLGPRKVITGGRNFIKDSSPRSREQWLAAVKELERQGLIEDRSGKQGFYFVTHKGFQAIDELDPTRL